MNKKGVEQPQVIVYVLFVVVLTLAGIYVAFTMLGGIKVTFEFQDYYSRINTAAAKLMLTPECFAVENSYSKDGLHYQVSSGIIDWQEFNNTPNGIIDSKCLSGGNQIWVQLREFNGAYSGTAWTCPPPQTSCSEPSPAQLAEAKEWRQVARSYFVLIQNGTTIDKGILTVRLKG